VEKLNRHAVPVFASGQRRLRMKKQIIMLVISTVLIIGGCSGPLTGVIIDAETKQPIEGALIHAQWNAVKGFGLTHTETYGIQEVKSNREGKFRIPGVILLAPDINPPLVIIYKRGYVAWDPEAVFRFPTEDIQRRDDFKWAKDVVIEMEKFKIEYSHAMHLSFIDGGGIDLSEEFKDTIKWEKPYADREWVLFSKIRGKKDYKSQQDVFLDIVREIYTLQR
jgi:hypothetical protein